MNNNVLQVLQNIANEKIKLELNRINFVGKEMQDFIKGKDSIDTLLDMDKNNFSINVQYALLLYSLYKIKGGK